MKKPTKKQETLMRTRLIIFMIIFTCIYFYVCTRPGIFLKYWWILTQRDSEFLIEKITEDRGYYTWFYSSDSACYKGFEALLIIGKEPDNQQDLEVISTEDSLKGKVAALALFCLGSNEEEMFAKIFTPASSDPVADGFLAYILRGNLDPEKHSSYRHELISDFGICSTSVKKLRLHALREFIQYDDVTDFLIEQTRSDNPDIRYDAFVHLRYDERLNTSESTNEKITSHLKNAISDPDTSASDRGLAVMFLASYGWTSETETIIIDHFNSGGIPEKRDAVSAYELGLHRPNLAIRLLYPGIFDSDKEISYFSKRTIIAVITYHYTWLVIIGIFLLFLLIKLLKKFRKDRDLKTKIQPENNS